MVEDRAEKNDEKMSFARDWIFNGTYETDVEFNGKTLTMRLLDSKQEIEASQKAASQVGNDIDRVFLTKLETLAVSISKIDGKPIKTETIRKWLEKTPTTIIRQIFALYIEHLVNPQEEVLKQVPN